MTHIVRPDTNFVLYINAFTNKCDGGYRCYIFSGVVKAIGAMLKPAEALAYLAEHPTSIIDVQKV